LKRAIPTKHHSSKRWFPWARFLALPAVAVTFSSSQDFRSPLVLSPYSVSFGEVQVGKMSPPQSVTLVNTGVSPVQISNIAVKGDFTQTNNCPAPPASLAKNDTCAIQVVFKPSAAEIRSGALTISQDAIGSPLTVALNGTGTLGGSEVAIAPSSLNFPAQKVGTRSAPQDITISNAGKKALVISNVDVDGDFTIMPSSTCETLYGALSASASCRVVVTFTPLGAGKRDGRVTFTDDAENSPQIVPLTGSGSQ
jgi:hypothetical protein